MVSFCIVCKNISKYIVKTQYITSLNDCILLLIYKMLTLMLPSFIKYLLGIFKVYENPQTLVTLYWIIKTQEKGQHEATD